MPRPKWLDPVRLTDALGYTLIAAFICVGRWSPYRLSGAEAPETLGTQLRFWLAIALLYVLAIRIVLGRVRLHVSATNVAISLSWLVAALVPVVSSAAWAYATSTSSTIFTDLLILLGVSASAVLLLSLRGSTSVFWIVLTILTSMLACFGIAAAYADPGRVAVLGGGTNTLGRLMGLLFLIAIAGLGRQGKIYLWLPLAALSAAVLVLTGSRGAFVATATATIVTLPLIGRKGWRILRAILAVSGAILLLVFFTAPGQQVRQIFELRIVRLTVETQYTAGRAGLYQAAFELWRAHPWMGAGLGSFTARGLGVYPHNLFLEIACDAGLLGLAPIVGWLVAVLRRTARRIRNVDPLVLGAFVLFFVAAQFSGDLFDSRALFLFLAWLQLDTMCPAVNAHAVRYRVPISA